MINQRIFNSKKSVVFEANLFVFIIMFLSVVYDIILIFCGDKIPKTGVIKILFSYILPTIAFVLIPIIVYFKISKKSLKKSIRLNKINFKTLIISIIILFLHYPIADFFSLITINIFPSTTVQIENSLFEFPLLIKICIVALMPAILEEITMRGIALSGYDGIGIGKTAIIIGFFFGALHRSGDQFFYTFIFGIILVYIVRITNSIIPALICHFISNGTSIMISNYYNKGVINSNSTVTFSYNDLIIGFILAVICSILIILFILKLAKINSYSDIKQVNEFRKSNNINGKIKIVNWPFVGIVIMWIFSIGLQLVIL